MPLAAIMFPSDAACAIELYATSWPQTSATPCQDRRSPVLPRPGSPTVTGKPSTARSQAARIPSSRCAQNQSYFDPTMQVLSGTLPKCTLLPHIVRQRRR
jgi:hypothetical protein